MDYFQEYWHYDSPLGADGTPYDYYLEFRDWALRTDRQIGWSEKEGGFWLVVGYEACRDVYMASRELTNRESTFPVYKTPSGRPLMIGAMDDPEHKKYRKLAAPPFSPKSAESIAQLIRETTNDLIDSFIADGRVDIVASLANEVPARAISIILGLPAEQGDIYRSWTHAMAQEFYSRPEAAAKTIAEMDAWFAELLVERRQNPGNDVLSHLLQAEADGEKLTDEEVYDFFVILLLGGIDNTTKLLSNFAWRLAWDTTLRHRLIESPQLMMTAVDEALRFYSPATTVRVVGHEAVSMHGCDMRPGQFVVKMLPIVNRDPREFPDPDTFRPDRTPNRHVALGLGIHRCLGAHLLKMEARVAMTELLRRIPDFELDPDDNTSWLHGHISGMQRVPIVFESGEAERHVS